MIIGALAYGCVFAVYMAFSLSVFLSLSLCLSVSLACSRPMSPTISLSIRQSSLFPPLSFFLSFYFTHPFPPHDAPLFVPSLGVQGLRNPSGKHPVGNNHSTIMDVVICRESKERIRCKHRASAKWCSTNAILYTNVLQKHSASPTRRQAIMWYNKKWQALHSFSMIQ